jgi:transposase, IS5 family
MNQRTLAMMTGFERYTKQTRRAVFLEETEQVVPWGELCALIEPHYPQPGKGRPPIGVERMLRIYFLQQLKRVISELPTILSQTYAKAI